MYTSTFIVNLIEKSLDKTRFLCCCCCCYLNSTSSRMLNKMFNSSNNKKKDSIHFLYKKKKSLFHLVYFFHREGKSCALVNIHKFYSKCVLSVILKLFAFSGLHRSIFFFTLRTTSDLKSESESEKDTDAHISMYILNSYI